MKTYKEEYTFKFGGRTSYYFDANLTYIYHVGNISTGKIHKNHFEKSIEINRESFSQYEYEFKEINDNEVPIKMKREMLVYILDKRVPREI